MANKYPDFVMETLRQRLDLEADDTSRDYELNMYSPSEAFEEMLNWEGIIGYADTIKYWIESIYGIDLDTIETETEIDKVEVNKQEVFNYFKNLISDKETWKGDGDQIHTTSTMIHGALVFANAFDLITNDEHTQLITIGVPTETEEDDFEEVYRHELREAIESEFAEGKYDDYDEEWSDDSGLYCADCPPSDCDGHCFSCSYRNF